MTSALCPQGKSCDRYHTAEGLEFLGWIFIKPSALLNQWLLGPVLGTARRQLSFCWKEGTKQRTGAAHGLGELGREREGGGKGGENPRNKKVVLQPISRKL